MTLLYVVFITVSTIMAGAMVDYLVRDWRKSRSKGTEGSL